MVYDLPRDVRRWCGSPPGRPAGRHHPRRGRPREVAAVRAAASPRPDSPGPSGPPDRNGSGAPALGAPAPGPPRPTYQVGLLSPNARRDRARSTAPPGPPWTNQACGRRQVGATPARRWSTRACGLTPRRPARPGRRWSDRVSRPLRVDEKAVRWPPSRACGRRRRTGRSGSSEPVWPSPPISVAGPGPQDGPGVRIRWLSVAPARGRAPRPYRQRTGWADRSPMAIVSW